MHAPKLLPWLARKAGVPLETACALWPLAEEKAAERLDGAEDENRYWQTALAIFCSLLSNPPTGNSGHHSPS